MSPVNHRGLYQGCSEVGGERRGGKGERVGGREREGDEGERERERERERRGVGGGGDAEQLVLVY